MENQFLIDLSVKYGLDDEHLSKVVNMCYQLGFDDLDAQGFRRCAAYMCSMNLLELPPEELIEEMKRKGYYTE